MLKIINLKDEVKNRPNLKKIVLNSSWIFTDNGIRIVVNFVVSIWIARYLGPDMFGALSYSIAFVSLFNIVANLGINDIVVRELVKFKSRQSEIMGSAFVLKALGAVLSILIAAGFVFLTRSNQPQTVLMVFLISCGFIFQSLDVIDLQYQSKVMSKYSIWAKNSAFLLTSALKVYFILSGMPVVYFASAVLIEAAIGSAGVIYIYHRQKNNIFRWKIDKKISRELFLLGLPILLAGTLSLFYLKIDRILIGQIMGDDALGKYSAATALCDPWIFVPSAIATSVFPAIISTKTRDSALYVARMQQLYSFLAQIAFIIAVVTAILSPFLIKILYGQSYSGAASVLSIYIWTIVFVFIDAGAMKWFLVEHLQRYLAYRALIGAVSALALNYFLVGKFGIIGGAVAAVSTQFVVIYLSNLWFYKTRVLFRMQTKAILDVLTLKNFKYFFKR